MDEIRVVKTTQSGKMYLKEDKRPRKHIIWVENRDDATVFVRRRHVEHFVPVNDLPFNIQLEITKPHI